MFHNEPGKTIWIDHNRILGSAQPIQLPPYRLPHAYHDVVQDELSDMLTEGIIEPLDTLEFHNSQKDGS